MNQKLKTMNQNNRTGATSLNNLFEAALNPVIQRQVARTRKQFKPQFARFKLKFYYLDGNASVHFSYDFYHSYEGGTKKRIDDEALGFSKLLRCIEKNDGKYLSAVIWATLDKKKSTDESKYQTEVFKHVRNGKPIANKQQLDAILIGKEGNK